MPVPNLSLLSPILHPLCFRSSKNRLEAESTSWRVRSWYKCPLSSVSGPLSSVYSHLVSTYSWNHKIKFFFCFLKIRKARNTKMSHVHRFNISGYCSRYRKLPSSFRHYVKDLHLQQFYSCFLWPVEITSIQRPCMATGLTHWLIKLKL